MTLLQYISQRRIFWLLSDSNAISLLPNDKLLYFYIIDNSDDWDNIEINISEISERLNLSRPTIHGSLGRLCQSTFLTRHTTGAGSPNNYQVKRLYHG